MDHKGLSKLFFQKYLFCPLKEDHWKFNGGFQVFQGKNEGYWLEFLKGCRGSGGGGGGF